MNGKDTISKIKGLAKETTFQEEVKLYGAKLLLMRVRACGDGMEYIKRFGFRSLNDTVTTGLIVYKNVLWMSLFCAKTGFRFPQGCIDFTYRSFWNRPTYYRFRSRIKELHNLWSIHNFKESANEKQ